MAVSGVSEMEGVSDFPVFCVLCLLFCASNVSNIISDSTNRIDSNDICDGSYSCDSQELDFSLSSAIRVQW